MCGLEGVVRPHDCTMARGSRADGEEEDDRRGEFRGRTPAVSDLVRSGQLIQKATARRSACGASRRVQGHGGMVKAGRREETPRQTAAAGHRRGRQAAAPGDATLLDWNTAGAPPVAVAAARGSTVTPLTTASGERRPPGYRGGRSTRCVGARAPAVPVPTLASMRDGLTAPVLSWGERTERYCCYGKNIRTRDVLLSYLLHRFLNDF